MSSLQFFADAKIFGIALTPWKIIGLSGSLIFGLRFLIQWIASERARKSVIPFGFWECSAIGSLLTLSYFAIYRQDGHFYAALGQGFAGIQNRAVLNRGGDDVFRAARGRCHGAKNRMIVRFGAAT